ncbi:MAG: DNA translocase FtsK [Paludibacter sp.]|nr:DNA translocase FtsK [Bacteroidales bacterium]MCM1069767.1 DNA translocase FtsK [Prevotella sp.]MCM1354452.1 DNA translocase FtsK [Bacteroides sp.]MCM1443210.1 DNA translocase FtsK [Muribaculum sp.]MCM1482486.1 DNA translocase FtsK [Paludibacter sp.]
MAPRKPNRPSRTSLSTSASNSPETQTLSIWKRMQSFLHNDRVQYVVGVLLLCFVLYTTIAFLSFFFTGKADFSILEQTWDDKRMLRNAIRNWGGLQGAVLVRWLLDGTFGLASLSWIVMLFLFGLRLLNLNKIKVVPLFFHSVFWVVWGSAFLGFLQEATGIDGFFRWGGLHGETLSRWMISYIEVAGMFIVLTAALIIFFIATNANTIPNLQRCGKWMAGLFKRKKQTDVTLPADEETVTENTDDIIVNTPADNEPQPANDEEQPADDGFVVNIAPEDELVNEDNTDMSDDDEAATNSLATTDDTPAEIGLVINETETTELSESDPDYLLKKMGPYDPRLDLSHFKFPTLNLLKTYDNETAPVVDNVEQNANKDRIVNALRNYGIEIKSIAATVGPTVTLYEIVPKEGIKLSRIKGLEDDIMMSLAAEGIRIIAPMPGKGTVGIEVPNRKPQVVSMHSVVASRRFQEEKKMRLPVVLGKTITNEIFMFDLAKTPHLLVAGATGQGKSVGLNAILTSLLYKKHPSELKLVLVDPKMVEFTIYKDLLHHYMAAMPDQDLDRDIIITDCTKVINTLNSLVIEMENRYKLLMEANCRNLEDYNEKFVNRRLNPEKGHRFLPYIVIVIDEFGDFIMQAGKEVERPIARITQKARAVGMHMILATQRPSVNIITGVIKANIPTRIAFRCQSVIDSRTVLDVKGAEGLIGRGDMLYSGGNGVTRIQCAFVDTPEVIDIVKHIKEQQGYTLPYELPEYVPEGGGEESSPGSVDLKRLDPMFADVARFVVQNQQGSTSILQRKFQIGYNRAGKLSDQLEAAGIVGPNKGSKGREVLVQDETTLEQILQSLG